MLRFGCDRRLVGGGLFRWRFDDVDFRIVAPPFIHAKDDAAWSFHQPHVARKSVLLVCFAGFQSAVRMALCAFIDPEKLRIARSFIGEDDVRVRCTLDGFGRTGLAVWRRGFSSDVVRKFTEDAGVAGEMPALPIIAKANPVFLGIDDQFFEHKLVGVEFLACEFKQRCGEFRMIKSHRAASFYAIDKHVFMAVFPRRHAVPKRVAIPLRFDATACGETVAVCAHRIGPFVVGESSLRESGDCKKTEERESNEHFGLMLNASVGSKNPLSGIIGGLRGVNSQVWDGFKAKTCSILSSDPISLHSSGRERILHNNRKPREICHVTSHQRQTMHLRRCRKKTIHDWKRAQSHQLTPSSSLCGPQRKQSSRTPVSSLHPITPAAKEIGLSRIAV